ncbi:MAG: glycoside hydrolase family 95 protein [Acidimicrobiales bacterium]|jgi:alpha-L-fucosidase 2
MSLVASKEFRLWYRQPASKWLEALPLGNGRLGAMLWGGPRRERVDLNIDTLWSGGPRTARPEGSAGVLAALRAAVLERRAYAEADALALRLQGSFNEAYQPLGYLIADFADSGEVQGYERCLDMRDGIASVRYEVGGSVYEREALASGPDGAFVMHLKALGTGKLNVTLELGSSHPSRRDQGADGVTWLEGRAPAHVVPHYWDKEPAIVYDDVFGLRFAAGLALRADGGVIHSASGGSLRVEGARSLTLFVVATTGYAGYGTSPVEDPVALRRTCREVLAPLLSDPYDVIRARHVHDHAALFDRCWLQLGRSEGDRVPTNERLRALREGNSDEGLCALLFHYGRYLLIASSRPGTEPANLQGIWNDQVRPPWSCNWTTNINTEMNYWHAETTNLAECHEPLMDLVADLSRAGVSTAKDFYGCRGWAAHHNVDLWRSTWPTGDQAAHPYWVNWQMGGPWLCQHLWEHYAFSESRPVLERAYPVMRGSALFLLDYLTQGPDGKLVTCPSISPENRFFTPDGTEAAVSAASTMDIWLTRDLFRHCITASEILGLDEELRARLTSTLAMLREPQVAADGRLQEWWEDFGEPEPGHRHLSHLFCLYPGEEVTPRSTPGLAVAARRSLEHRLANGGGGPGWSRAWVVGLWARLLEGHLAWESLRDLIEGSLSDNFFGSHDPGVFQIDANFGAAAAIGEMLLQSHSGTIDLLPALPPAWPEGQVAGLRARGGLTVGITWQEGRVTEAHLDVPSARVVKVRCASILRLVGGEPEGARFSPTDEPGLATLETPAPGTYTLRAEV